MEEKEQEARQDVEQKVALTEAELVEEFRSRPDYVDDDYEYSDNTGLDGSIDVPQSNRPKSLIEQLAINSKGGKRKSLHGNQALFEEFVKLAIERQRWENAARVHDLIQVIERVLKESTR